VAFSAVVALHWLALVCSCMTSGISETQVNAMMLADHAYVVCRLLSHFAVRRPWAAAFSKLQQIICNLSLANVQDACPPADVDYDGFDLARPPGVSTVCSCIPFAR
jgi:hypothetical protein